MWLKRMRDCIEVIVNGVRGLREKIKFAVFCVFTLLAISGGWSEKRSLRIRTIAVIALNILMTEV